MFPPKQSFGEDYKLLKPTGWDQLLRLLGDDDYPVANQELVIFFEQDVSLYGVSLPHGCNLLKKVWSYR